MQRFAKQTILIVIVALAAFAISACKSAGGGSGSAATATDNAVAATVNGKNIMLSEVDRIISQQAQGQQAQLSPLQLAQARLQVLNGLIQKEVLFQRAEKEKLLPSEDEINQFVNDLKSQSGMTEEQFQKRLKDQNETVESLREEARKTKAIQKLQERAYGKITISDKEVEDFYNNNKQQFVNARGVGLASIIVDPADNSAQGIQNDARNETEAKQKIDLVYQTIKSGADFATVARERSEDANSLVRGGDLGFATEDDLKQNGFPPELIGQFFNTMQVGSYTNPVRFNNGRWYIFKLSGKRAANENLTLDSQGVREQITEGLRNQRKQILDQALLQVAMGDAKVVNNLATTMLTNPDNLSGPRPAQPAVSASPAATASASASPQATATPAATATASPAASAKPSATAKPAASPAR